MVKPITFCIPTANNEKEYTLLLLKSLVNNTDIDKWYFAIFTNPQIDCNCMTDTDICEITTPYYRDGIFKLYNITLTRSNYYINYGFYKNGLLVDSTV